MIKFQSSVLFVKDLAASHCFYADLLEQRVDMDHGEMTYFESGFALWQFDDESQRIFNQPCVDQQPEGCGTFELYFQTETLDAVWDRLEQSGIKIVHPIREQPWGQRVFRVFDPDHHIVAVGEPFAVVTHRFLTQGMGMKDVSARNFMPLEIIIF
ncbi:glyoxalase [bacterium]|nr:glyoxalase [bacterium]